MWGNDDGTYVFKVGDTNEDYLGIPVGFHAISSTHACPFGYSSDGESNCVADPNAPTGPRSGATQMAPFKVSAGGGGPSYGTAGGGGQIGLPVGNPLPGISSPSPSVNAPNNPTTNGLVERLRELPCEQRREMLAQAAKGFDGEGELRTEYSVAVFGRNNGSVTTLGSVVTSVDYHPPGSDPGFTIPDSGPSLIAYFGQASVRQTIQDSGLAAIFMSHTPNVNTSNLPRNIARITQTGPVPLIFYSPQGIVVIGTNVQPVIDQNGPSTGDVKSVRSNSPGIESSSTKDFTNAILKGCP